MSEKKIDNSQVTPATGTKPDNKPIADTLANELPISDSLAHETSPRSDPDKIIPGSEARSGVDGAEEEQTTGNKDKAGGGCCCC